MAMVVEGESCRDDIEAWMRASMSPLRGSFRLAFVVPSLTGWG
jgi:hypothetical protein